MSAAAHPENLRRMSPTILSLAHEQNLGAIAGRCEVASYSCSQTVSASQNVVGDGSQVGNAKADCLVVEAQPTREAYHGLAWHIQLINLGLLIRIAQGYPAGHLFLGTES
jgi:hypothetical protein